MPNKSRLISWTYRTCWNSGVQLSYLLWAAAEIVVWDLSQESSLSSLHSVLIPPCPVLFCPVKHSPNPALGLRYHRALCLGRGDDRIRQISQASNVKEPTRFMVTSWIVGSFEGHDSAIRSVFLFCYRTSTSATLYQDKKKKHFIVCQNRVFTT